MHWKPMPVGGAAGGLATAHGQGSAALPAAGIWQYLR